MECRLRRRIAMNPESECWEWTGVLEPTGYGRMSVNGRNVMAHRICYELHVGPIPDGLFLDHLCHNRRCVNPEHLEPVTPLETAA